MDFQRIEETFDGALAIEAPEQRAAFVAKACAGDAEAKSMVESLLAKLPEAGSFPETPISLRLDHGPRSAAGDRINRYKLLEKLGEGGCGEVFVAKQEEPVRRRVALKIIKLGMDTPVGYCPFRSREQLTNHRTNPIS